MNFSAFFSRNTVQKTMQFLLLGLALGCSAWVFKFAILPAELINPAMRGAAGIITNGTLTRFNEAGAVAYHVKSPLTHFFAEKNQLIFNDPDMTIYQAKQAPTRVRAEEGETTAQFKQIDLHRNVRVEQETTSGGIKLTTSTLTVYPDRKFAETAAPAVVTEPGMIAHTVGLQADLKTETVKFLSHVEGEYHAQS